MWVTGGRREEAGRGGERLSDEKLSGSRERADRLGVYFTVALDPVTETL